MCADTFSHEIMRSTSQHIFEKVLICIERDLYNVYFKEMNLFKNVVFIYSWYHLYIKVVTHIQFVNVFYFCSRLLVFGLS